MSAAGHGVAVVTGGSRGIGRAICLEAARRDYDVLVCCGSQRADAELVATAVVDLGRNAAIFQGDLANRSMLPGLVEAAHALGPATLLVNNAGTTLSSPLAEMTSEMWDSAVAINLTAPIWLAKLLAPELVEHRGAIVNVGSTGGLVGSVHSLPYAATKAGLVGATKTLARMLAPDVRVNLVAPGIVDTDLLAGITDAQRDEILDGQLIRRLGDADDIARVVLDVAQWPYATGQVVVVDGGRAM